MAQERILGPVGKITNIKPAAELGSQGLYPVAIIEHQWFADTAEAWISIPEGQEAEIGDNVRIASVTEGNVKTLQFTKIER